VACPNPRPQGRHSQPRFPKITFIPRVLNIDFCTKSTSSTPILGPWGCYSGSPCITADCQTTPSPPTDGWPSAPTKRSVASRRPTCVPHLRRWKGAAKRKRTLFGHILGLYRSRARWIWNILSCNFLSAAFGLVLDPHLTFHNICSETNEGAQASNLLHIAKLNRSESSGRLTFLFESE
jgi:hypothetical protein